ncbi:MAG: TetR/AcrR family transcriptional regulator [Deltaproteobacteria bacterium]|nr:TetR/AcrR family transcriptional regulator [Deltaproteobacteria bacterium]
MDRREAIKTAAIQLFAEKGYHATSTHEVALRAEVSEGTVFYHFQTKEGILAAIFHEMMDSYLEDLRGVMEQAPTGMAALENYLTEHFRLLEQRPAENRVLVRDLPSSITLGESPHNDGFRGRLEELNQLLRAAVVRGQADGSVNSHLEPEETIFLLRGLVAGVTKVKLLGLSQTPDMSEAVVRFCRRALQGETS